MIAESARSWVKQHLKFTVTFGISGPAAGLSGLSDAYRKAAGALERKLTGGPDRVYAAPAEGSPPPQAEGMDVLVQAIGAVPQLYRLGNDEWRPLMERIFGLLAGGNYSKEDIVRLLQLLEAGLSREMQELPPEMKGIWNNGLLRGIPQSPESFEWIEELRGELLASLEEMEEALHGLRMNREQYTLANKVREYIALHYADPDFSLTHAADSFAMNTKALSRIFKEEIGENFVDYLARLRMDEAKRLLTETSEPVQNIWPSGWVFVSDVLHPRLQEAGGRNPGRIPQGAERPSAWRAAGLGPDPGPGGSCRGIKGSSDAFSTGPKAGIQLRKAVGEFLPCRLSLYLSPEKGREVEVLCTL
jgi:two-component system response regulator YesN